MANSPSRATPVRADTFSSLLSHLREALIAGDLDTTAAMLATMVRRTLAGISDHRARDTLAMQLATLLQQTGGA
ncbi:hypothetical protein B0G83_12720 [Paraburkholderia sp. BL21I4N1]|nr:hypothetical protein B0G83_12720 [Paraburkholderia sp. BL21I4N1]